MHPPTDENRRVTSDRLFHLVSESVWREVGDAYAPASLGTEGFVHLSTAEQVAGTAALFFAGVEDLLVLRIDVPAGDPLLRWEAAEGPRGTEDFPHYHGPIPRSWVVRRSRWRSGAEALGRES